MTAPTGRPDALIDTDHGPARVYSAHSDRNIDAAIVTDDYELLIPKTEIEHLVRAIAPHYDTTDPDEPTATTSAARPATSPATCASSSGTPPARPWNRSTGIRIACPSCTAS